MPITKHSSGAHACQRDGASLALAALDDGGSRLTARYGTPVLAAGYTAIPNLVRRHWRALGATYGDFYLYQVVMEHKWTAAHPRLRAQEIAAGMGTHGRQVREHVARLERLGLLVVRPGPRNRSTYNFDPLHARVVVLEREARARAEEETAAKWVARDAIPGGNHRTVGEETAAYQRNVSKTSSSTSIPPTPVDDQRTEVPKPARRRAVHPHPHRPSLHRHDHAFHQRNSDVPPVQTPDVARMSHSTADVGIVQAARDGDDRPVVALVEALSAEFGDTAASNVTQARNHRREADLAQPDYIRVLNEAAARTRARRHKLANPMGYFFIVVRDLLFNPAAPPGPPSDARRHAPPARAGGGGRAGRRDALPPAPSAYWAALTTIQQGARAYAETVADDIWRLVLCELAETMTVENFDMWLRGTFVVERDDQHLVIGVPQAFNRDWLERKLHPRVDSILCRVGYGHLAVAYVVAEPPCAARDTGSAAAVV